MSRIKISKQLERASAPRYIVVSNSSGDLVFEGHAVAIAADANISLFDLLMSAVDGANDYLVLYSAAENKTVKISVNGLLALAGGGGAVYTFKDGVTESGGTVRLGGTQEGNVAITGDGNDFALVGQGDIAFVAANQILIQNTSTGDFTLQSGGDMEVFAGGDLYLRGDTLYVGDGGQLVRISDVYTLPNAAPSSASGVKQIIVATGNGTGAGLAWENKPTGGGGAAASSLWYELSVDTVNVAERCFVKATDITGMTFTKTAPNIWTLNVPDEVDVDVLQFYLTTAQNPGGTMKVRFNYAGNRSDGSPRVVNVDYKSAILPDWEIGNRAGSETGGTISDTYPILYSKRTGTGFPTAELTGFSPLELTIKNFNTTNGAGNAQTVTKVTLPGS